MDEAISWKFHPSFKKLHKGNNRFERVCQSLNMKENPMKKLILLGGTCLLAVRAIAQDDSRPPLPPAAVARPTPGVPEAVPGSRPSSRPGQRLARPAPPGEFEDGIIEEQGNLNPEAAAKIYDSAIRNFDREKQKMGRALLAAAEAHRKLGHAEIADKYFERLKTEYPDLAEKFQRGEAASGGADGALDYKPRPEKRLTKLDKLEKPEKRERPEKVEQQQIEQALSAVDKAMKSQEVSNNIDLKPVFDIVNKTLKEVDRQLSINLQGKSEDLARAEKQLAENGQSIKVNDEKRAMKSQLLAKMMSDDRSQDMKANEMVAREQMDMARSQLREAQRQIQSLRVMKDSLGGPVEALPKPISDDPRYKELKKSYETLILSMADTSAQVATNAVPLVVEKMRVWVDKIFIPELQSALMKAEREVQQAKQELDQANDELSKTRQLEKKLQDEERASQNRAF